MSTSTAGAGAGAGPSRIVPAQTQTQNQPPKTPESAVSTPGATRRSPGRSFSLSIKSKGKLPMRTGLHDRRWDLDFGGAGTGAGAAAPMEADEGPTRTPTTAASTATADSSLRRTVSSEDTMSTKSSSITTAPPSHPPPKDPVPRRPPEKLLSEVRAKMSTKDQEAMRKLRLTMDISDSSSSGHSHATSPLSPFFAANGGGGGGPRAGSISSHHSHAPTRPPLGSRQSSALSRQIVSEDLDDGPILPIAAQHVSFWTRNLARSESQLIATHSRYRLPVRQTL